MADTPTDGERDLAALCARLVRRLREVAPDDKLAATATDYLSQRRYLNPLRIRALDLDGVQECFPMLDPNVPEGGSRYPDKGCYRVGCPIHGGPDASGVEDKTNG